MHRIVKPVGMSRGRGIRLVSAVEEVEAAASASEEALVVQRYLTSPLLVQVRRQFGGEEKKKG